MGESRNMRIVGVDGGGTSCRIGLLFGGRRFVAERGSANVLSDSDGAIANILSGLEEVAAQAGLSRQDLKEFTAVLGLAGIVGEACHDRVAQALPFDRVVVTDDRQTSVAGALGDDEGTVAGLGTGSYLARRSAGRLRILGGWGFAVGDEASGAWLGRRLLAQCLRAEDGLEARSDITARMLARFGGPMGIVAMSGTARPAEFARLAPDILQAARAGDPVAAGVVDDAVAYIVEALSELGWTPAERLCLIGGLGPHYVPFLPAEIAASVVPGQGSGLDGALALAARLSEDRPEAGLDAGPSGGIGS